MAYREPCISTASFCNAACHFSELENILGADVEKGTEEDDKTNQRYGMASLKRIELSSLGPVLLKWEGRN